jgi:hypothetical protein
MGERPAGMSRSASCLGREKLLPLLLLLPGGCWKRKPHLFQGLALMTVGPSLLPSPSASLLLVHLKGSSSSRSTSSSPSTAISIHPKHLCHLSSHLPALIVFYAPSPSRISSSITSPIVSISPTHSPWRTVTRSRSRPSRPGTHNLLLLAPTCTNPFRSGKLVQIGMLLCTWHRLPEPSLTPA